MSLFESISREWTFLSGSMRMLKQVKGLTPETARTVPDIMEETVRAHGAKPAIIFEGKTITWRQLDQMANRMARVAIDLGIGRGDVVALLMENRPEYIATWFGLHKIGAVGALINTNLAGAPLAHSIGISGARHLVLGAELADSFATAKPLLEQTPMVLATGGRVEGSEDLDAALAAKAPAPVPPSHREGMLAKDKALYIYTSGTTGMPKAANISHLRMQNMFAAFNGSTNATDRDIMYNVLPLYHTAGGVCAIAPAICAGGAILIKRKFSASQFWDDCAAHKPTLFQYIGELCRYLLNAPPHIRERSHHLRLAIGNGLRPEIWPSFQQRFKIPHIIEFYGATEGNVALLNLDGKTGAIGRIPNYLRKRLPVRLVKFDIESEQPVRDPGTGFCSECAPGEAGEAIGKIDPADPRTSFEGYTKQADSEKKLLRDVFEKGDIWFRTGDLLRKDAQGYFYFVDRIGDTFRWKGENVATSEVAEALSVYPGVKEANVYGVKVPGADGKAGMASIVASPEFRLDGLAAHLEKQVPAYARPLFLRLSPEMEITGTFKHRKVELVKEGFDPATVNEPLHFLDPDNKNYVPLDAALHARIAAGDFRF